MATPSDSPYDEIPYENFAYPQAHPQRLATVATLFGMEPRPIHAARVLELGCACGGHLLPMAAACPDSQFVGVDLSGAQIAEARAGADALGLTNLQLHAVSLTDLDAAPGSFDYIIAHGVYSWVPAAVRDALMAQCARFLAPAGVAYISYNTRPGSHARETVREIFRRHTRGATSPAEQVAASRALLSFLATALEGRTDGYATLLREELAPLAAANDSYLAHEYLEEANHPCYFHEFVSHAAAHGLQYLGEAEVQSMSAAGLSPAAAAGLKSVASSLTDAEQHLDFLRNRPFRQTLLCHADVPLKRAISPALVARFHFASAVKPAHPERPDDLRPPAPMDFCGADGAVIRATEPITKAALLELGDAWPRPLAFADLVRKAAGRTRLPLEPATAATLAHFLLSAYSSSSAIEFQLSPPAFQPDVLDFPTASPLTRWQASRGERVTNARHENILLGPVERTLLTSLDGTRSLATLTSSDPAVSRTLARFAAAALLQS